MKNIRGSKSIFILILLIAHIFPLSSSETSPPSLDFYVLSDGTTEVNYKLQVNSTEVSVILELPGPPYLSLLISNQEGLPLEYIINSSGVTVETLGSSSLDVLYFTQSITSKTENIWELKFTAPITCKIVLPEGSMIIGLNQIPLEIGTEMENPYVIMDSGPIEVTYIKGVIDQRALAEEAIQEAQNQIQDYRDQSIIMAVAETLLNQSIVALELGNFDDAIDLAQQAIHEAQNLVELELQASESITQATLAIQNAKLEKRTQGLEEAETLYEKALSAYDEGDYSSAQAQAIQSQLLADSAEKPRTNTIWFIAGGIVLFIVGAFYIYKDRIRDEEPGIPVIVADLEKIYEENPRLRMDDKEVIRYIAENRGELFANEIRERFDIPRTSLWRMIRRLKDKEILEERKVGGQSLISIHRRYRK
jgi:uncharacterized membrane protein